MPSPLPAPRRPSGCSTSPTSTKASGACGAVTQPPWCVWCPTPPSSSARTRSTNASWAATTASVESETPLPQKSPGPLSCHLTVLACLPPVHHAGTSLVSRSPRTYLPGRPRSPLCPRAGGEPPALHSFRQAGAKAGTPQETPLPRPSAWPPVPPSLPTPQTCGHPEPWGLTFAPTRFQSPAPLAPPPRWRAGWNHGRLADLPAGPGQSADGCDPKGNVSLTLVTFSPAPGALCLVGFLGGPTPPGPWG